MVIDELKTCLGLVEKILENYPDTRDCNKALYCRYLKEFTRVKWFYGDIDDLRAIICEPDMPNMESLTRLKRLIQAEGRWVGEKRQNRLKGEQQVREYLSA